MKYLSLFFVLFSLLLTSSVQRKGPQTREQLGQSLFELLKTNDSKKLKQLTLPLKQYKEQVSSSDYTTDEKQSLLSEAEQRIQKRDVELEFSTGTVRNNASSEGVRWESATYLKTVEHVNFEKRPNNSEIEVYFLASNKVYKFWATDCIKFGSDWYLGFRKLRWVGEDK